MLRSYDALGRRSERTTNQGTTTAHYGDLGDRPTADTDSSGITKSWVEGPTGLVEERAAGLTAFPLTDAHGDITTIADDAGIVQSRQDYDPWGDQLSGPALEMGWLGAQQKRFEPSIGAVQMGVRVYDPTLARFLSEDPVLGYFGVGQSINRHSYVWNAPLDAWDLPGLGPCVLGFISCDEADDPCDSLMSGPMLPLCLVPEDAHDEVITGSAAFGDAITSSPGTLVGVGPDFSVGRWAREALFDKPPNVDYDSGLYDFFWDAGKGFRVGLGGAYRWGKWRPKPNEWPYQHPPRDLDPLP